MEHDGRIIERTHYLRDSIAGRVIQDLDWSGSQLGGPDAWPPALRTLLAMVFASPSNMVLAWGPNLLAFPNDACIERLGCCAENVIGKSLDQALPEVWVALGPMMLKALERQASVVHDAVLQVTRTGRQSESWWDSSISPVFDESGGVAGVLCINRETTTDVLRRRARDEATARLRNALAAGDEIGAWDWDVLNDRVKTDTRFALFYCVDPEFASSGLPLQEYMKCMHPDDRDRVAMEIRTSIETGEPFYSEYRLVGADGQTHWISAQGEPVYDENGRCVQFPGISWDVTLRRNRR
jgi:PAS domain-containing protein